MVEKSRFDSWGIYPAWKNCTSGSETERMFLSHFIPVPDSNESFTDVASAATHDLLRSKLLNGYNLSYFINKSIFKEEDWLNLFNAILTNTYNRGYDLELHNNQSEYFQHILESLDAAIEPIKSLKHPHLIHETMISFIEKHAAGGIVSGIEDVLLYLHDKLNLNVSASDFERITQAAEEKLENNISGDYKRFLAYLYIVMDNNAVPTSDKGNKFFENAEFYKKNLEVDSTQKMKFKSCFTGNESITPNTIPLDSLCQLKSFDKDSGALKNRNIPKLASFVEAINNLQR